jgi:nitroreductase
MNKLAATQVPLHPLLASRWSPRAFDSAHALTSDQISALLEAARWAPSANNSQPWRFLVGTRGDAVYQEILDVLAPGNQVWAGAAGALILVVAETADEQGNARPYALYDTGQAVANLVAQAGAEDLSVHQMGGFDAAAAVRRFGLGAGLQPVVVIAAGRHDPTAVLTPPLAERERAPRARRPVRELLLSAPLAA